MDIGYKLLLNMMMPMVIDHHRHMHDFFLRHGHGYLNELFKVLLNNSLLMVNLAYNDDFFLLLRDMVIDDHFLFDMMMTVMMHYNGDEDHFFCAIGIGTSTICSTWR